MISRRAVMAFASAFAFGLPQITWADEPMPVVASFSILGDMVDRIGGDHIALTTLVGPNGDTHVFQPTPSDARSVADAKVLFINGLEFEGWIDRLAEAAPLSGTMVVATDGIDAIEFGDHEDEKDHDDHDDHAEHDDHDDHGSHGFEWAGVFDLKAGTYKWSFAKVGGDYADPAMRMVILEADGIEASEKTAKAQLAAETSIKKKDGDSLVASDTAYTLSFDASKDMTLFDVEIAQDGKYAFFTEHMPFEFEADEHFFKDLAANDVEPVEQEPDTGHAHHHHGAFDPHAWQSIDNAMVYVNNITNGLSVADPTNADAYAANRDAYLAEFASLKGDIDAMMASVPADNRTVVTSHDAFRYLGQAYDLHFEAPQGMSTESEASAADVAELIEQIREEGVSAVFVESITDNRLLEQIAAETGVTIGGTLYSDALSGADEPASTYIEMMRHNALTLSKALGGS